MVRGNLKRRLVAQAERLAPPGTHRRAVLGRFLQKRFASAGDPLLARNPTGRAAVHEVFDEEFYLREHPDVAQAGVDPLTHYLTDGWREGRDPTPGFSTEWYLQENPDIREAEVNPFVHWVLYGRAEGRVALPPETRVSGTPMTPAEMEQVEAAFSPAFYLRANPDVVDSAADPFRHFMTYGWREGRDPSPDFSVRYYLAENNGIRQAGQNPFAHWVLHGQAEGRHGCAPRAQPQIDESRIDWQACDPDERDAIEDRFDAEFYLAEHPDVAERSIDPVAHYLLSGWRKGFDPTPDFSTRFYIDCYRDIRRSGQNPFVHWCRHGRDELRETQSYIDHARRNFRPLVSVILPNYNHAPYLHQRIASIAGQSYDNLEIIILDDNSSDDSQLVIREAVAEFALDAKLVFNQENSGNVFAQWRKGLELATGDLVWICESDDFCELDFLEHLIPAFADNSVNIAFGRIQFSDAEGGFREGLDGYRESAEEGIWHDTLTRPAHAWFNGGFGVNNMIANVGGCVFRRMPLPEAVWEEARRFKICGDWFLYIHIAGAGQITYDPRSVSYFRQHDRNTSATNFHRRYYYQENMRILAELVRIWGIAPQTRERFLGKVRDQYRHLGLAEKWGDFDEVFGTGALLAAERTGLHVQLHFLGFHPGGGELFPINLANALLEAGMTVSMMAVDMLSINADMRARLGRRIPVYHVHQMNRDDRSGFLAAAGVSVINSHVAASDAYLANISADPIEVPYVVTLHGSYVGLDEAPDHIVDWILDNVTSWIFTADRNLEFFESREVDWDTFVKLPNAMPRDPRPAPFTREEIGVAPDDVVFTLVARGIQRKGWRAAVEAFRLLQERHGRTNTHLLMIGDGEATEVARSLAEGLPRVHFLGYQSAINGILRLSDCLLLPSRFEGESYPLCLIQAIQEHVPAISTDVGEIGSMMTEDGTVSGILLENRRDSRVYFSALTEAMNAMCDPEARVLYSEAAKKRARIFEMDGLVASYREVYVTALRVFRSERGHAGRRALDPS